MSGMSECMLECQHFLHLSKQHICKSLIRFLRGAVNVNGDLTFSNRRGVTVGNLEGNLGGNLEWKGTWRGTLRGNWRGTWRETYKGTYK